MSNSSSASEWHDYKCLRCVKHFDRAKGNGDNSPCKCKLEDDYPSRKDGLEMVEHCPNFEPYTLDNLFKDVCKWIYLDNDRDFFDVVLACSSERKIRGLPLWLYVISKSGGLKSTMASLLRKCVDIYMLDTLTPNTLVSGKVDSKGKPIRGLLPQINGKVLVIKDFSTMLTMHPDKRNAVFGQLRTFYDGYSDSGYGTMNEKLSIESIFGLLIMVTPMIDDYTILEQNLGTRFLRIRHRSKGFEHEISKKAMENEGHEEEIILQLQTLINMFISMIDFSKEVTISDEWKERIRLLSHYVALMRTQVKGEWWKGQLQAVTSEPLQEEVTRLPKQFIKLAKLLTLIRGKTEFSEAEWNTLVRVAEDTISPYTRSQIVKEIIRNNYEVPSIRELSENLEIGFFHIRTTLQLMEAVHISELDGEYENEREFSQKTKYKLTDKARTALFQVYSPEKLVLVKSEGDPQ